MNSLFDKNCPAKVRIQGDAARCLEAIIHVLEEQSCSSPKNQALKQGIKYDKEEYFRSWPK